MRQAAIQAGRENIEKARKGISRATIPACCKQIEANGVAVVTPTAEERAAFVAATRPVYDKWAKTIGAGSGEEGGSGHRQALRRRRDDRSGGPARQRPRLRFERARHGRRPWR